MKNLSVYDNDLTVNILKKINEKNLIPVNEFSENFNIDKEHADWIIQDLLSKGYIKKNELGCTIECESTECKDPKVSIPDTELRMVLELTEKGKRIIL